MASWFAGVFLPAVSSWVAAHGRPGQREYRQAGELARSGIFRCGPLPSSPSSNRSASAPHGLSNGLIWPKDGFASTA